MTNIKTKLRRYKFLLFLHDFSVVLKNQFGFNFIAMVFKFGFFLKDYFQYLRLPKNFRFKTNWMDWQPYLKDKTTNTPLDPIYFYQDSWLSKNIFKINPTNYVDIGSSAKTIGILSQFTPVTMVDIRPIPLQLEGLNFVEGSILNLPFDDNCLACVSSICVIEHIGLGRYGDPLDSFGSEKALLELKRVIKSGGHLLFSVPVDKDNKCNFNAARTFTRDCIMELTADFQLVEEKYQYGNTLCDNYDSEKGFGTGMFWLRKK